VLLETDGPFLAPQAHRGKRNEPAWIPLIAKKIAELRQCDIKEVAEATYENAKNLFYWTS
jgi:TatD DNase family protein